MKTTTFDSISESILNIRAAAGNPNTVCPTCGRIPSDPFRSVHEGRIVHGCVDAIHSYHVDLDSESGRWHNRREAIQIRQREMSRLRKLVASVTGSRF